MRTTDVMWMAQRQDGQLAANSGRCARKGVILFLTSVYGLDWSGLRRAGWRVVKVKVRVLDAPNNKEESVK